jgi:hypothetical protein
VKQLEEFGHGYADRSRRSSLLAFWIGFFTGRAVGEAMNRGR